MQQEELQLQNQLLIAMPGMGDPRFSHAVILIARHNAEGCFGITVNHPTRTTMGDLFKHLNIPFTDEIASMPVLRGGPVQPEQGFVVHDTQKSWENTLHISDDLAITASRDILGDIAEGRGPEHFFLALGCASWSAGQVEDEILQNAWLSCPVESAILFETPYSQRWQSTSRLLGFDVGLMPDIAGHA